MRVGHFTLNSCFTSSGKRRRVSSVQYKCNGKVFAVMIVPSVENPTGLNPHSSLSNTCSPQSCVLLLRPVLCPAPASCPVSCVLRPVELQPALKLSLAVPPTQAFAFPSLRPSQQHQPQPGLWLPTLSRLQQGSSIAPTFSRASACLH